MLIKGENLLRKCANFIHSTHLEVGSSILPRRKFCPKSLMGDAHEIFCVWKRGSWFESSPLQFELYSRDSIMIRKSGVFLGHP